MAILTLSATAADSGIVPPEANLPTLDQCRFLGSAAAQETRAPLPPARLQALYAVLEATSLGTMIARQLGRYADTGVGLSARVRQLIA